jgi:hypothetical protein
MEEGGTGMQKDHGGDSRANQFFLVLFNSTTVPSHQDILVPETLLKVRSLNPASPSTRSANPALVVPHYTEEEVD